MPEDSPIVPVTRASRAARRAGLPLRPADLRGLSRLGVDSVVGVTGVVEAMHHNIASASALFGQAPTGRPGGVAGLVYRAVRGTTRAVGLGLDALWAALPFDTTTSSPEREAFLAALNGIFGDHLADTGNPLAIQMQFRVGGQPWREAVTSAGPCTGRLLVLVHGLAMNDLQWSRRGHDHGLALARDLGFTPVYLHYNSGRHVSQNGRDFAARLSELVAAWPVPVRELAIVAHSMGGLVARSACSSADASQPWRRLLTRLVCLGTPHHGAPLERGGRLVDTLLGVSPYAAPLARLGQARSAGITDLRFGNLQDADWQRGHGHAPPRDARHEQRRDDRQPTPLPEGVATSLVAATTAATSTGLRSATVGDGLVPLASALGEHRDPALTLQVPPGRRLVVTRANHWDLLSRADVYAQLRRWLA